MEYLILLLPTILGGTFFATIWIYFQVTASWGKWGPYVRYIMQEVSWATALLAFLLGVVVRMRAHGEFVPYVATLQVLLWLLLYKEINPRKP